MPWNRQKNCERLVIELKDKVSTSNQSLNSETSLAGSKANYSNSKYQDAVSSLITLGYKLPEADKAGFQKLCKIWVRMFQLKRL